MAPDVNPESLRQARFRTVFRGLEPNAVGEMLEAAAKKLEAVDEERRKLKAELDEMSPGSELDSEFETLGREVTAILQSAREAAESMRERASLDAAKWRAEALADVDTTRKEAAADAEALRRDAWVTGTELLRQATAAAEAMRAKAERDVLTIMGEAEREAHRLTSASRRDAEDMVRNATMEAEKITADAVARRDDIIDGANRQAATAQERARALEQRRDELMEELENVRSTLTRMESSLEERREALERTTSETTSVRVVHNQPEPPQTRKEWELGETVRVVPTGPRRPFDKAKEEALAEAVQPTGKRQAPVEEPPAPEPTTPEPEPVEETAEAEVEVAEHAAEEPSMEEPRRPDEVGALFASLRGGDWTASETTPETSAEARPEQAPAPEPPSAGIDWIEVRESRLIPITNRALRGVKRAMTDVQNLVLDRLRTDGAWKPSEATIAESFHAELVAVWAESFSAGHAVAEEMVGSKLKRPPTPRSRADRKFATDLARAVSEALSQAGEGPRERQSAASRVFRVWRNDEAERRIRDLALTAYEAGIDQSRS